MELENKIRKYQLLINKSAIRKYQLSIIKFAIGIGKVFLSPLLFVTFFFTLDIRRTSDSQKLDFIG